MEDYRATDVFVLREDLESLQEHACVRLPSLSLCPLGLCGSISDLTNIPAKVRRDAPCWSTVATLSGGSGGGR